MNPLPFPNDFPIGASCKIHPLDVGFCSMAAQTGRLPRPMADSEGNGPGDYTGGQPIWPTGGPSPVPACGSL